MTLNADTPVIKNKRGTAKRATYAAAIASSAYFFPNSYANLFGP